MRDKMWFTHVFMWTNHTGHCIYLYLVKQICSYSIFFIVIRYQVVYLIRHVLPLFSVIVWLPSPHWSLNIDILNLEPNTICYTQKCALGDSRSPLQKERIYVQKCIHHRKHILPVTLLQLVLWSNVYSFPESTIGISAPPRSHYFWACHKIQSAY